MVKTSYPRDIQILFEEVVVKIKGSLDPDFILLTGSFGKESWLFSKQKLLSDFEIVFVCNKKWSVSKKKQLVKELNKLYPYDIELKGYLKSKVERKIISNYASKNSGYINLNFFDTFNNPNYLYKKSDSTLNVKCSVGEIPVWEAWRLYVNRIGDLLKLECSQQIDDETANYYWLKIFESTADAYCIINKNYNKNISKRLEIFNKQLIENDEELSEICKKSFPIIQEALLARENHDLSIFQTQISISNRKLIINSWMKYFEKKLVEQEHILIEEENDFYKSYLANSSLQRKYIDFNSNFNVLLSNLINLVYHPNLLNSSFKFYNQNFSWRHIILLSISSTFSEQDLNNQNFTETKKIVGKLINKKVINNLNKKDFIQMVLNYWKILR